MQNKDVFLVYNASAGSGKTYTLVKEYLKVLLQDQNIKTYQNILAMTFTNKASTEMKQRILTSLKEFSERKDTGLLDDLHKEPGLVKEKICEKSQKILNHILENYSNFNITTIDAFTHKLIRTFAKDLDIPVQFEVVLEADELLRQAVQRLISKIGEDRYITKILIQFSLENSSEDKSWDITYSLNEIAKILLKEEDLPYLKEISKYDFQSFPEILKKVRKKTDEIEKLFKNKAQEGLDLVRSIGIANRAFYRSYLPNFFDRVATSFEKYNFVSNYEFNWEDPSAKKVCDGILYSKSQPQEIKDKIDWIADSLISVYEEIKILYEEKYAFYFLAKMIGKHWVPLAVLRQIEQELTALKQEKDVQLNTEFNKIISEKIKNEPTPFIYERLGEKISSFFLDEMQDTSVLQWENLEPLIRNVLSSQEGKLGLLLVGDAKQSVYRWRGGDPRQFIKLTLDENPFPVEKKIKFLPKNYRSYSEIVTFNNDFFKHIAKEFKNKEYEKLYIDSNEQKFRKDKEGGFICLEFLEQKGLSTEEKDILFPEKIKNKIETIEKLGYQKGDICVLVRKNKQGIAVADYLSNEGILITSSETLLVKNSREVQFLVALLYIFQDPLDKQMQFVALEYICTKHSKKIIDTHHFYKTNLKDTAQEFINTLKEFVKKPLPKNFWNLPFYEKVEALVNSFALITTSDAYVEAFLELVLEFSQKNNGTLIDFLEYWEQIKDKKSIIAPPNKDAINIMTIHKSKGLEFPVVIFAYDLDVTRVLKPTFWCEEIPEEYGVEFFRLPLSQKNKFIGKKSKKQYDKYMQDLEFDNINLLYVALTRAEHQLHVIMPKQIDKNGKENTKYFSGKFISFLKYKRSWKETQDIYEFGKNVKPEKDQEKPEKDQEEREIFSRKKFISVPREEHNIDMKEISQESEYSSGVLWHSILSRIYTAKDIENVIEGFVLQEKINIAEKQLFKDLIEKIVYHSELRDYFLIQKQIYTEREIIDTQGKILIPDRLVFQKNKVSIIDYKTGEPSLEHIEQINKYTQVLRQMGYVIDTKFLIYLKVDKQTVEIRKI